MIEIALKGCTSDGFIAETWQGTPQARGTNSQKFYAFDQGNLDG